MLKPDERRKQRSIWVGFLMSTNILEKVSKVPNTKAVDDYTKRGSASIEGPLAGAPWDVSKRDGSGSPFHSSYYI